MVDKQHATPIKTIRELDPEVGKHVAIDATAVPIQHPSSYEAILSRPAVPII